MRMIRSRPGLRIGIIVLFVSVLGCGMVIIGYLTGFIRLESMGPWLIGADDDRFLLTLYDVPVEELAEARSAGFEAVHLYDSQQSLDEARRYLEGAQEAGLQVVQNMPSSRLNEGQDFWVEWVSTLADYDNLAWWYLPEEPGLLNRPAMRRLYKIVRRYDPKGRPAVLYFGTTHLEGLCDMADFILVPAYPEYHHAPRADTKAWIDNAQRICPSKPVVSVQTLFDANFDGTGDRPTPAKARGDVYAAIIAGSRGLAWYSYSQGRDLPELWPAVQGTIEEIHVLSPIINSPPITQTIRTRVVAGPTHTPEVEGYIFGSLQMLQKSYGGVTYVFAVNLAEVPTTVQFEGLSEKANEVSVLFEARTLSVVDHAFVDVFPPAAAHIYKITDCVLFRPLCR